MRFWPYLALFALVLLPLLPMPRITVLTLAHSRDAWLRGVLWVGIAALATREPCLALVGAAALLQWKDQEQVASVVTYGAIIGMWLLVQALPTSGIAALPIAFAIIACVHTVTLAGNLIFKQPLRGLLGHRTFSGAVIALTLPFAWPYAAPVAVSGLLASQSWLAWIAGAVALGMMAPWTLALSVSLALVAVVPITRSARVPVTVNRPPSTNTWLDKMMQRGTSIDGIRARWAVWGVLVKHLTWLGRGPGSAQQIIRRSAAPSIGHAHCEPLEYVVEYGVVGALAVTCIAARIIPHLRLHDPWSAAVVAGAVLMLGSTPARVAQVGGVWWAECAILATR